MVINVLRQSNEPLTIEEVGRRAGINRITASKYLAVLEARGVVKCRNVGKAKLYSLVK
ncbi:MAG: helix-turn-helix domain-containing protein [Candidatus Aenigmatarchaeota archaeon]